ncbi:SAP domain containing protein [Histomonas meleagridis]|uniref:SAP domain containing protein n=1 Tax=Histomonas meleagridis TaxID=135588 RepID=UPI003559A2CA|nr:SAP domain containing protein [Histomonas meleagridis]KAH0800437.1 SAP domain containing protein [Histomonas meleagridis]
MTTVQDPNIIVKIIDNGEERRMQLRVQHANDNITFSFFKEADKDKRRTPALLPEMYYSLSEFSSFELSPNNEDYISFLSSNPLNNCTFFFTEKKDISKFMQFLGQRVHVVCSNENPYVYILQPLEYGKTDFQPTILPTIKDFNPQKMISLERFENFFKEDNDKSLEISELFDPNIQNQNVFDLFKKALSSGVPNNETTYSKIKKQWKLIIFPDQFDHYSNLETLIEKIEKDILERSERLGYMKFANPKKFQKITFNILLTYSIFNWDGGFYFNGQIEFLYPLLKAYVLQHGEDCNDEDCEESVFNVFADFYDQAEIESIKLNLCQKFIKPMLVETGKIIDSKFHEILELLQQRNIQSLDFFIEDCRKWFIDILESAEDKLRLWISVLSVSERVKKMQQENTESQTHEENKEAEGGDAKQVIEPNDKNLPKNKKSKAPVLSRGLELLSIAQLRDLLRDYSLPTGGKKKLLVERLLMFLETFATKQQNVYIQFQNKLKALLTEEHDTDSNANQSFPPAMIQALNSSTPSIIYSNTDYPFCYGPVIIQGNAPFFTYTFSHQTPVANCYPVLCFSPVVPGAQLHKITFLLLDRHITLSDGNFWFQIADSASKVESFQVLSIEPPIPLVACVRWLGKVPLPKVVETILSYGNAPDIAKNESEECKGICPLTNKIMLRPARGVKCNHKQCFDLTGYLSIASSTNNWICPVCKQTCFPEEIRVDTNYFF